MTEINTSEYKSGCYIPHTNTAVTCEYCGLGVYSDKCKAQQAKGQIMIGIYYGKREEMLVNFWVMR